MEEVFLKCNGLYKSFGRKKILKDVSFTPNQTLGRKIYSFNCTANEVAQCNEDNYIKYNIIKDNLKIFTKENQQEDNDL